MTPTRCHKERKKERKKERDTRPDPIFMFITMMYAHLFCCDVDTLVNVPSATLHLIFIYVMRHPRPLFHLFSTFQTNSTTFTTNQCEKMSIQYTVLGFEPTTFAT